MRREMLMLVCLVGAHLYFDYAGQGDFMAKAKNRSVPSGVPWRLVLWSHAAIHGAAVAFITGLWWLFAFETVAHAFIDRQKCEGRITFAEDQAAHFACKLAWWLIALYVSR